jgi:uncharacterized protein
MKPVTLRTSAGVLAPSISHGKGIYTRAQQRKMARTFPPIELSHKGKITMSSAEIRGRFVWHDLLTTDTKAAGRFYPRVAGWKSQPWEKNASYTLWVNDTNPLGGVTRMPEEMSGTPAHWMPHIGTPNIAGTVETARDLGGKVCREVTELPEVGAYAVLGDPQGATFAVYQPGPMPEGSAPPSPAVGEGDFCWHELATTDPDAALNFYVDLFGWEAGSKHDMGEMGFYQIFRQNGEEIGGIYRLQPGLTTPHWLSYVRVSDVNRVAKETDAGGGRVLNGPMEVPGGALIAQLADPQGAMFAVHQLKPVTKAARKATAKAPPREEVEAAPPVEEKKPVRRVATARRPAAAKKATASKRASAKRRSSAGKRASSKRAASKGRSITVKRASAKRASVARKKRPVTRKRVATRKRSVRRRLRARKRR